MKKEQENSNYNEKVQKALNKLISDEWFAGNVYMQFVLLMDAASRKIAKEQFIDVANDELNDHMASLVDFALTNNYDVPATYSKMKKEADKEDVKLFEDCKRAESLDWYLQQAIDAEERAIETYEKYVDDPEFAAFPILQMTIQNNYYDEVEHLKQFKFMKYTLDAAKMVN